MGTIQSRVDELIAQMTPAEKAGQLTQYFYFRLPAGAEPALGLRRRRSSRKMVEAALREGGAGSLLFVTDPAEINRLQRLAVEGNRLGHPAAVRLRRHPRAPHDPPGADRDGGVVGPGDDRARPGGRRPRGARGRHPLGVRADGRHRPRPALGPDHRGRRRGSVPRRGRRRRPGARLPGRRARARPSASSPARSTSPATAPPSAGATTTRSTSPTPSCGTSTSRRSRRRSRPAPAT